MHDSKPQRSSHLMVVPISVSSQERRLSPRIRLRLCAFNGELRGPLPTFRNPMVHHNIPKKKMIRIMHCLYTHISRITLPAETMQAVVHVLLKDPFMLHCLKYHVVPTWIRLTQNMKLGTNHRCLYRKCVANRKINLQSCTLYSVSHISDKNG